MARIPGSAVPEELAGGVPAAQAGRESSMLTGGRQQQGVTQGDGPTEIRVVKQLQGCGEGKSKVGRGPRSPGCALLRGAGQGCSATPPMHAEGISRAEENLGTGVPLPRSTFWFSWAPLVAH